MEIKVTKDSLASAVGTALKAVPVKTSVPIMECILFTVANDEVRLTSNNGEIGVDTYLSNAEIKEDGSVCVDAKTLSAIVSKLPDGEVTLKVDDSTMLIKSGKSKFKIATKDGSEFPNIDAIPHDNQILLSQDVLKEVIKQTAFSASVAESNKMMTGVLFDISDNLKVVALDGHRIAMREITLDKSFEPAKLIIPSKTLQEIAKLLSEGDVELYYTNNQIAFSFDNTVLVSRLIEGNFFDVNKMINDAHTTEVKVDRLELLNCVDRATLLVKEIDRKPVLFTIDNHIKVEIATQLGSMDEDIEADVTGNDLKIGLNPRFLIDVLRILDDDKVTILFNGEAQPCYIKGENYLYLILPIKF